MSWPFNDPENRAAMTTRDVMCEREPILLVTHDEDDGCWQFISASGAIYERAMMVCLREVVEIDSSLRELADLPRGWEATRAGPGAPWVRQPQPPPAPEDA